MAGPGPSSIRTSSLHSSSRASCSRGVHGRQQPQQRASMLARQCCSSSSSLHSSSHEPSQHHSSSCSSLLLLPHRSCLRSSSTPQRRSGPLTSRAARLPPPAASLAFAEPATTALGSVSGSAAATTATAAAAAGSLSFSKVLAVVLGYCVMAGSLFRSVPQIVKVVQHNSTEGLSLMSYVVELCCYSVVIAYNLGQVGSFRHDSVTQALFVGGWADGGCSSVSWVMAGGVMLWSQVPGGYRGARGSAGVARQVSPGLWQVDGAASRQQKQHADTPTPFPPPRCVLLLLSAQGYGFNTFGEVVACWIQDIILIALVFKDRRKQPWVVLLAAAAFTAGCSFLLSPSCPQQLLATMQASNIAVMALGSRLPQILLNMRRGNAGMLSVTTCLLNVAGNAARIFTTIVLTGDLLMLGGACSQGA